MTDKAVAQMLLQRPNYRHAFNRYYLNPTELSEYEIGLALRQPVERITAILRQARILVGHLLHVMG